MRFVELATDALGGAREEIDALNVYPVPDGDTGTNMFLTVSSARDALLEATGGDAEAPLAPALAAMARGALLGARGNSGVILAQMLGAVCRRLGQAAAGERHAQVTAEAMAAATEASWAAVGTPVEGTILSVSRAASEAAVAAAADPHARSREVYVAAAAAAREALARTPEQLPLLAEAGVVDAGGRGLCVLLDAAETALTGRRPVAPGGVRGHRIPAPRHAPPDHRLDPDGPSYEVMYLLDTVDPGDDAVATLRRELAPLGDSLVVVGGQGLWNVHVHVDDVGAALEAGLRAGRPHRVRVTHFAEQLAQQARHAAVPSPATAPAQVPARARTVVAVAAGPGLRRLFEDGGAVVVEGGPGRRPSTGELLEAVTGCGSGEVVVLPNDPDSVRTAEIAARTAEESGRVRVAVIPTHAQVQGLAALAVHEPGRAFDSDVLEMTATARHARHGAVTVAARRAMTSAGPCEPGDVLGVVAGDFVVVGERLEEVAAEVLDRLLGGGGELVTVVTGADAAPGLRAATLAHLEERHPTVDVAVYHGGQERYPLLVSVE
nr:DAK2 domain-containing protein [Nocardioides perillae]